jgi:hypothetical protein
MLWVIAFTVCPEMAGLICRPHGNRIRAFVPVTHIGWPARHRPALRWSDCFGDTFDEVKLWLVTILI